MKTDTSLDPHLNAFRQDLADARLKGRVDASRFVSGTPACVQRFFADVKSAPRADAGVDTQFLAGEPVTVFETANDWAWVQSDRDGYVGYVAADSLGPPGAEPTHVVSVPRTFVYPGPDLKLARSGYRSMGTPVAVVGHQETRGTSYAILASGEALFAGHLRPLEENANDYVAVAETLIQTPYLWGGTTGFGLDCSGLVQLAMREAGRTVLRDTYMQAESIGSVLSSGATRPALQRGDLVFWKGHVAIMTDSATAIHANANTMAVSIEPVDTAIERIERLYGAPTVFRRP